MAEHSHSHRLKALEEKIGKLKGTEPEEAATGPSYSQGEIAWRMVIELVAGLLIGFGIGYGLDSLLGTMPIMLVIFTLLGFVAGIKTMLRSAEEIQKERTTADEAGKERD